MRIVSPKTAPGDVWNALTSQYGVSGSYGEKLENLPGFKTEAVKIDESKLKVSKGGTLPHTSAKYPDYELVATVTLNPTDFMKSHGKRATLVFEADIYLGTANRVYVKTTVNDGDEIETSYTTSGEKICRHIHSDIVDFSSSIMVKIYLAVDTGTGGGGGDYTVTLQIGTKSTNNLEVMRLTNVRSINFVVENLQFGVWTGATDTATLIIGFIDTTWSHLHAEGSNVNIGKSGYPSEFILGAIGSDIQVVLKTSNGDNPAILKQFVYQRAWLE